MDNRLRPKRFLKRKASIRIPDYFQGSEAGLKAVLDILHLPKKQRSERQVDQLVEFTHNIKVFTEISEEMSGEAQKQCCECLGVEKCAAGKVSSK
jgi:hypothetical protein